MKISKLRQQIAQEAARLIFERSDLRRSDATQMAIQRLCSADAHPRDVPGKGEICGQLETLRGAYRTSVWEQRYERYVELLRPLASVMQPPESHPEGDALYHSLQVFQLAKDSLPYDEELLAAALLHDIGKSIDRRDPVSAGAKALEGLITQRTAWLIENLSDAHRLAEGTLGARASRRLDLAEDFDELVLLAKCDSLGRQRGIVVPDTEDAVAYLSKLDRLHSFSDDQ